MFQGFPGARALGRLVGESWGAAESECELYGLVDDPDEVVNRCDDPGYATIRIELEERMWPDQEDTGAVAGTVCTA